MCYTGSSLILTDKSAGHSNYATHNYTPLLLEFLFLHPYGTDVCNRTSIAV